MLSAYLICLVVGGVLVGLSLIGGHDGHASDLLHGHFHLHLEAHSPEKVAHILHLDMNRHLSQLPADHVDAEHAVQLIQAHTAAVVKPRGGRFVPLLSMRFWTFGSCFFGMTGCLLTWFTSAGSVLTALLSSGIGAGAGLSATWIIHHLRENTVSSDLSPEEHVGCLADVTVPIEVGGTGKVRLTLAGQTRDVLAVSRENGRLDEGIQVLIIGYDGNVAQVVHAGRLTGALTRPDGAD
jgi:hypothetical protein